MTPKIAIQRRFFRSTGELALGDDEGREEQRGRAGSQQHEHAGVELAHRHADQEVGKAPDHAHGQKQRPAPSRHDGSLRGVARVALLLLYVHKISYEGWRHGSDRLRRGRGPAPRAGHPDLEVVVATGSSSVGARLGVEVPALAASYPSLVVVAPERIADARP